MTVEELERKIRMAQEEIQRSGPLHSRDLWRHIKRLKKQIAEIKKAKEAIV